MGKLVDTLSLPSTPSILDLYSVPPTQIALDRGYWHEAHLVNSCTSDGPWQFIIQSDPQYLHLNRNYIYIKLRIKKPLAAQETGVLTDTDLVAPINLLGKTLFKQVRVYLNGKLASDSGPMYAYRAFLETELNYGFQSKLTFLQAGLYEKDMSNNEGEVESQENKGFGNRLKLFKESALVELMAPIHCDLFMSDRLMLSNTEITLDLHRNSDKFLLISFTEDINYYLSIEDMKWYVRKVELADSVHLGIERALMRNTAKYPLRRVEMKKFHIPKGSYSVPHIAIFNGQLPRRLVIGFIESDKFFGTYKTLPFFFKHHNVSEISVRAGGETYPREPLKLDFANNIFVRAYLQMFEDLGMTDEDRSNCISMWEWKTHKCLFVFDMTPEETDTPHWQLLREGSVFVDCTFASAVTNNEGLEMIVYAEFDNLAMVDRMREIYHDYTV